MAYPHSRAETIADGAVHVVGLLFAVPFSVLMIQKAASAPVGITAPLVYVLCMIASFTASALYHLSPVDRTRPLLRRIDHATIFLKIAGTYTPLVAIIETRFAYSVLGVVWVLAVFGVVSKLWLGRMDGRGSVALYLGMGWLSMLLIWPMWQTLGGIAVALIIAGGLIYSAGTLVYSHPGMRFQNALWHSIVLLASISFFAAIMVSL